MGAHYQRACLLFNQGRYELAERELREELAENPHYGRAHAFLGRCLAQQKRWRRRWRKARKRCAGPAICLTPTTCSV